MRDDIRQRDEQDAVDDVTRLVEGIISLLDRQTAPYFSADRPRYGRWCAIHATADALQRLLLSALDDDPDDAAPRVAALLTAMWTTCTPPTPASRPN